ncbi:receptor protein [Trifolium repens]|nr:receptor protein [Trifolium repens]
MSQKLVHWNQSNDCCQWNGVECNNKGQVIALDLSNEFISGQVESSLFNLNYLESLNLAYNEFHSEIHYDFQNLNNLRYLNLSNSGFQGNLPNSISDLTQLVYLDLSFNNFNGSIPSFNRSKSLKVLSLNHNNFKGLVPSTHFEGLVNLISIDLGDNLLNGSFPSSLFKLQSLKILFLYYNKFDGKLEEIPNASLSLLEMVDLSGNNFEGPIPMSMFKLKRLRLLLLSKNKFDGTIQLDVIGKLQNLSTLALSHNNLSIDANIRYGHEASSFPNLKRLWLSSCKLREFPEFLKYKSSFVYLDLSSNQISGQIPNWIWRFDYMVILNVSNNFLTGFEGPLHTLTSNLLKLDLHSNQLQGHAPTSFQNAIYLDYSSNRFTFINVTEIGNRTPFLFFLSLSNNSFSGTIHESFCNISRLRALDLSHNSFDGSIPICLTRSSTFRLLHLGGNQLNGHVSDTFSTSCSLRFLDLSGNHLKGTIPKSLANCNHLEVLNLGNNQLFDGFPCFLNKISSLRVMILRSNKLHGSIECPNNIDPWETLQIVDLAANNFRGKLPAKLLQSWKSLMIDIEDKGGKFGHLFFNLYDDYNPVNFKSSSEYLNSDFRIKLAKLNAAFPPFLIKHIISHIYEEGDGIRTYEDSVTIVNKGHQLNLVKIFIAFTSLDFSSNQFEGPIPKELMSLKALHALNLSQNAFSGSIPSSLGNLKHLESLDFSINSLSGEIPTELARLSYLAVMNLSCNHLVGKIPTGTQIQSFEADSFIGNEGLCGLPLTQNCSRERGKTRYSHDHESSIDWNFLSVELGFTFGFGIFILPLFFWKRWRMWYSEKVDGMLYRIVPQLGFVNEHRGGKTYRILRRKK